MSKQKKKREILCMAWIARDERSIRGRSRRVGGESLIRGRTRCHFSAFLPTAPPPRALQGERIELRGGKPAGAELAAVEPWDWELT